MSAHGERGASDAMIARLKRAARVNDEIGLEQAEPGADVACGHVERRGVDAPAAFERDGRCRVGCACRIASDDGHLHPGVAGKRSRDARTEMAVAAEHDDPETHARDRRLRRLGISVGIRAVG